MAGDQSPESGADVMAAVHRLWVRVAWMVMGSAIPSLLTWGWLRFRGGGDHLAPANWDPLGFDGALAGLGIALFLGSELSRIPTYRLDSRSAARAEVLSVVTLGTTMVASMLGWLTVPVLVSSLPGMIAGCGTGLLLSMLAGLVRPDSDELRAARTAHQRKQIRLSVDRLVRHRATRRQAYVVNALVAGLFALWPVVFPALVAVTSLEQFTAHPSSPLMGWLDLGAFGTLTYGWLFYAAQEWRFNRVLGNSVVWLIASVGVVSAMVLALNGAVLVALSVLGLGPFLLGVAAYGLPPIAAIVIHLSRFGNALMRHRLLAWDATLRRSDWSTDPAR